MECVIIFVVLLGLSIFALMSEIRSYNNVDKVIPIWDLPKEEQEDQYIALACYPADILVGWRTSLLTAVVVTIILWILFYRVMTPCMALAIAITVFLVTYFIGYFSDYHYFRPLCRKARRNYIMETDTYQNTCIIKEPASYLNDVDIRDKNGDPSQ